ncbi:MAG TPA: nucleotidyltransferase domain-containing protein [Bryobacteraceae bacterium]
MLLRVDGKHSQGETATLKVNVQVWQDSGMGRQDVIAKLRQHEPELRAAGVLHLSLFGSVARGERSPKSGVDLMAEFDPGREYSLLDRVRLERRLAEIVGAPVDLAPMRTPKGRRSGSGGRRGDACLLAILIAPSATFSARRE